MLYIIVVLLVLWLLCNIMALTAGGLIHLLLIASVVLLLRVISGRPQV